MFNAGEYLLTDTDIDDVSNTSQCIMCNTAEEDTEALSLQSRVVIILFCAASFVNGLGYAPVYSLGMAFIDNQSKNQKNSGSTIYLGTFLILPS